jgi:hypothetical protein
MAIACSFSLANANGKKMVRRVTALSVPKENQRMGKVCVVGRCTGGKVGCVKRRARRGLNIEP